MMTRALIVLCLAGVAGFACAAKPQTNFTAKRAVTWRQEAVSIRGDQALIQYRDAAGRRWAATSAVARVRGVSEVAP